MVHVHGSGGHEISNVHKYVHVQGTEEGVAQAYEARKEEFQEVARRKARHILIKVRPEAKPDDVAKAKNMTPSPIDVGGNFGLPPPPPPPHLFLNFLAPHSSVARA